MTEGHTAIWAASESRYWIIVARSHASSISNSVLPGTQPSATALSLGVLALADDHVEPVILQVQRLAGALHAVSDDGYRFVFEGFERFAQGEFFARDHVLDDSSEIHFCHGCNVFWLIILCFISFLVLFLMLPVLS